MDGAYRPTVGAVDEETIVPDKSLRMRRAGGRGLVSGR